MNYLRAVVIVAVVLLYSPDTRVLAHDITQRQEDVWRDAARCGINAAYLLLRLHSIEVAYDRLLALCPPKPASGTTLADLHCLVAQSGLSCSASRLDLKSLTNHVPAIVHMETDDSATPSLIGRGHFSLVFKCERDLVWLIDGTTGSVHSLPATEFRRRWSGYALSAAPMVATRTLIFATIAHCLLWCAVDFFRTRGA